MEEKDKDKEEKSTVTEKTTTKVKVGTLGNYALAVLLLIIVATGALTYYLIHSAKSDYDKTYNDIVSNLTAEDLANTTNDTEEEQVDTIADIIGSAVANTTSSTSDVLTSDENRKTVNESLVVLYNGLILDTSKAQEVKLQYIDSKIPESDKYIITYYGYENFGFKEAKLGTFSSVIGDGLVKIEGTSKVALSEEYEAIPRAIKVINTVPTIVSSNNNKVADYDTVKTIISDLDGNGTEEYILILANKVTGFSKITLFDSNGTKKADLASIDKSQWKKDATAEYYLSYSNIEILDVDNDGVMEVLVEIPHAVGDPTISLLKYNNGTLDGTIDIKCSLIAQ